MTEGTPTLRRVPQVVVELRIEEPPYVRVEADSDADYERLADWIGANDALLELVSDAVELREQRGVA